jgi:uncharacterized phiE125 gp8 family phage protein
MLYNLLIDWNVVDDGSAANETFGLQSAFYDTTPDSYTETISALIGVTIKALFRESDPYERVSSNPSGKEYAFNAATGVLTFDPNITFNPNEKLFIVYTSGTETTIDDVVTVTEMKNYLRLEGFIDQSESISSEFNDDDNIIEELIVSARERLEEYTGLSFVPKTIEIEFTNLAGGFEIPFGPVTTILYLRDSEGDSISTDDFEVSLNGRILKDPKWQNMTMQYECGYSVLPKGLKEAVMKEVAYRYINRGDENVDGLSREAMVLASKYKTANWIG